MAAKTLLVLTLTAEVLGVQAIWPFTEQVAQQSRVEGMIDVGSLGIEGTGRVVAVGDWYGSVQYVPSTFLDNSSQYSTDLFVLSTDSKSVLVYLWDNSEFF